MPAPVSSLSPGDRRDPRCPVRGRGATWRSKSQDQMEKASSSTGGASSQSWAGNSAALGCHLSGIQVTQENPTSGQPPEADQKGEGAYCRFSPHPGSGLTVAPYLGTHSGLPTQPPAPCTIAPLLCYLNSLLYYPPAAVISPPIKRHRWDCWGSLHSVSCMLWRAQSRSLPGPWSRGLPGRQKTCVVEHASSLLSPLSCPPPPTYPLLLGPPYCAGVAGTLPALPGAAHSPQAALLHQTRMTSSSERLRTLDLVSQTLVLSPSLPQTSSFVENLMCALHLNFCHHHHPPPHCCKHITMLTQCSLRVLYLQRGEQNLLVVPALFPRELTHS